MNYYKRHIGDYYKKAGRLTALQHGVYVLLMDACYDREMFPTKEDAKEWLWITNPDEEIALDFILSKFFNLEDDGRYTQKRILEELIAYKDRSEKNRRIALQREENKRENRGKSTKRDTESTKRDTESTKRDVSVNETPPNHKPITNNHKPITNKKQLSALAQDETVNLIYDYWLNCLDRKRKPGEEKNAVYEKRRDLIKKRIKDGYTPEDICKGIWNCCNNEFNLARGHTDLTLICRNAEKMTLYINLVPVFEQKQKSVFEESLLRLQGFVNGTK